VSSLQHFFSLGTGDPKSLEMQKIPILYSSFLFYISLQPISPITLDPGPTYGKDYSGLDYNVTPWNSPQSKSPNHWEAAALECQALCIADPNCCSWTYCTPEAGPSDPERCCLKNGIPTENSAPTHWTGAPKGATQQCLNPPPPPYPGPQHLIPKVTNHAPCVQTPNWHDVAGALVTSDNLFHVFQGSNDCYGIQAGWNHQVSSNLVDWTNLGIEPTLSALLEPYGKSSPCSGFIVRDDDGIPCAGFRECGGEWPGRSNIQVPLEVRCAIDANAAINMNNFSTPQYLFWFYFNRNLPYDPVRPWIDTDNLWYATISADACNSTVPCSKGGALYLYSSPALRGPKANWQPVSGDGHILFASNWTVLTPYIPDAIVSNEFVTSGYFGNLPGDPRSGNTRCFTNNIFNAGIGGTTAYFCGTQASPGKPLIIDESSPYSRGMIDWGSFSPIQDSNAKGIAALIGNGYGPYKMARTLSPSSANQVKDAGRKIITAWIDGQGFGQGNSLARDLSLDSITGELLQQFSPELQALRTSSNTNTNYTSISISDFKSLSNPRSQQIEIVAIFTLTASADPMSEFGVAFAQSEDGEDEQRVSIQLGSQLVVVSRGRAAGPLLPSSTTLPSVVHMHIIFDHSIISTIVNNRTAITAFVSPRDANSTGMSVFGVDGSTITCNIQSWVLRDAIINNTITRQYL
jgi:hypothetical protein